MWRSSDDIGEIEGGAEEGVVRLTFKSYDCMKEGVEGRGDWVAI